MIEYSFCFFCFRTCVRIFQMCIPVDDICQGIMSLSRSDYFKKRMCVRACVCVCVCMRICVQQKTVNEFKKNKLFVVLFFWKTFSFFFINLDEYTLEFQFRDEMKWYLLIVTTSFIIRSLALFLNIIYDFNREFVSDDTWQHNSVRFNFIRV